MLSSDRDSSLITAPQVRKSISPKFIRAFDRLNGSLVEIEHAQN
jgi:hypothetical protein